jgi:hypothetical protein
MERARLFSLSYLTKAHRDYLFVKAGAARLFLAHVVCTNGLDATRPPGGGAWFSCIEHAGLGNEMVNVIGEYPEQWEQVRAFEDLWHCKMTRELMDQFPGELQAGERRAFLADMQKQRWRTWRLRSQIWHLSTGLRFRTLYLEAPLSIEGPMTNMAQSVALWLQKPPARVEPALLAEFVTEAALHLSFFVYLQLHKDESQDEVPITEVLIGLLLGAHWRVALGHPVLSKELAHMIGEFAWTQFFETGPLPAVLDEVAFVERVCRRCGDPNQDVLHRCGQCGTIRYCSTECQRNDWRRHRRDCRAGAILGKRVGAAYDALDAFKFVPTRQEVLDAFQRRTRPPPS